MVFVPFLDAPRLITLAAALDTLSSSQMAVDQLLLDAPVLDCWSFADAHWKCVTGYVSGHPRLGNTSVLTTPLAAIDSEYRWARTLNTLYRLREPAP